MDKHLKFQIKPKPIEINKSVKPIVAPEIKSKSIFKNHYLYLKLQSSYLQVQEKLTLLKRKKH